MVFREELNKHIISLTQIRRSLIQMLHEMKLNSIPFEKIQTGQKIIEVRLYDEKRRMVKIGDIIVFAKLPDKTEKIRVEVIGLSIFKSFRDLFSNFDKSKFGHDQILSLEEQIELQREHYTEGEEKTSGVIGIHIKLIK